MKVLQRMLFYTMSGIFIEVIFTALKTLYYHQDYMLHGNTQLWVVALYALGGLLFEQVHHKINIAAARVVVYLLLVYVLEYTGGWLLLQTLGACPWHYHEPGNIHGLVQLRYAPLWLLFAVIANKGIFYALNYNLVKISDLKNIRILITAMSENNTSKPWFFMRDYQGEPAGGEPAGGEPVEVTVNVSEVQRLTERLTLQDNRLEDLEQRVTSRLESMDSKLDKLIQSNKSLIAYFSAVNNRDARNLNYNIRSYASKKHFPPAGFVPDRVTNSDL